MTYSSLYSVAHVVNRGARKRPITKDISDKYRFLKLLYYMNSVYRPASWERDVLKLGPGLHFKWLDDWPSREPLVDILSYSLMPNHFHLLLNEIEKDGISQFMRSVGTSMAMHFNTKHDSSGALFQGRYKAKYIEDDGILFYTSIYINVKNPFELYNGGFECAINNFDDAYKKVLESPFSSLADIAGNRRSPIISYEALEQLIPSLDPREYKDESRELLQGRLDLLRSQ